MQVGIWIDFLCKVGLFIEQEVIEVTGPLLIKNCGLEGFMIEESDVGVCHSFVE